MSNNEIFEKLDNILLTSDKPSLCIKSLITENNISESLFDFLLKLSHIKQNLKYHPEGNVLNHIYLVIDEAAKRKDFSKDKRVLMWSALLHDIGKITTTRERKGRITSYNHDLEGEKITFNLLNRLTNDDQFIENVCKLVKFHMHPLYFDKNLPFFNFDDMINETNYNEVALLSTCDRLGRGNMNKKTEKEEVDKIKKFIDFCDSNT